MGKRRGKKLFGKRIPRASKEDREEADTLKLVNECLLNNDATQLRQIASARGLVSPPLRKRVWPFLLDAKVTSIYGSGSEATAYREHSRASHKDDAVVAADIERSLWKFSAGWTEEERGIERARLKNVINACLEGNKEGIYYYQGLHDVASVLLLVCGEGAAHGMLHRLMRCHLRDCTRATIDPAIRTLRLMYPLLKHADTELYDFIHRLSTIEPALELPYFALSWFMTWFAHDVDSLDDISRLFDLFVASHPMMPLYVAVEVVIGARSEIFKVGREGGSCVGELVYSLLNKLSITGTGRPSIEELVKRAVSLFQDVPPHDLTVGKLKRDLVASSCVPFAYLNRGHWQVPPIDEGAEVASKDIASHSLFGTGDSRVRVSMVPSVSSLGYRVAVGAIAVVIAGVFTASSSVWS